MTYLYCIGYTDVAGKIRMQFDFSYYCLKQSTEIEGQFEIVLIYYDYILQS